MVKQRSSYPQQQQQQHNKVKKNKSEETYLTDNINDVEIMGYINNKKEMEFKKALWEFMYKDYLKPKQSKPKEKQLKNKKKSQDGAVKGSEKKPAAKSSKVDYDMLKKFLEENVEKEDRGGDNDDVGKSDSREISEGIDDQSEFNGGSGDDFGDFDGGLCFENEEDDYGDNGDYEDYECW